MRLKVVVVIPSRYQSSRFPGKPLVKIGSKTMIQRVYDQAKSCIDVDEVIVATDDQRILNHVQKFGGQAMMTSDHHDSGTGRCGEVISKYKKEVDVVVNVQGDEPFIQANQISQLIDAFKNSQVQISTLAKKITDDQEINEPNVVKVVRSKDLFALYFSRSPIPYCRDAVGEKWSTKKDYFKHLGLYAFRTDTLKTITRLNPTNLDSAESLEQLRWLENGYRIYVGETKTSSIGIDTPEDLNKITKSMLSRH